MSTQGEYDYDRLKELKQFDESKGGVKALVDSGLTTIPRFFIHQPETLSPVTGPDEANSIIPTIDLSVVDRPIIVDRMAKAAREFGFFQIINHGISVDVMDGLIGAIRRFHEQPTEIKARYYGREVNRVCVYASNLDLFRSKAASWRDSIRAYMGPAQPDLNDLPDVCGSEILEWGREMERLGDLLIELLFEGLEKVSPERLKELKCTECRVMVGNYYPYCPEPDRTIGFTPHTDAGVMTILVQDHIGGLQIKHDKKWLRVKPIPGALVVNIGDTLQIMSNDEYKSVEHRAVANPFHESRISVAVFFGLGGEDRICGPLPELISQDKPAVYRQFTLKEFRTVFSESDIGTCRRNYFKI